MSVYLKFHLVQEIDKDLIRLEELDKATHKDLKETNEFSGFFCFLLFFFFFLLERPGNIPLSLAEALSL